MKKFTAILCAMTLPFIFAGCGASGDTNQSSSNNTDAPVTQNETASGTLTIIGSTTVQPLIQSIADDYLSVEPNLSVDVQGVGSSAGIKAVMESTADIGMASRELKDSETGIKRHVLAYDGIAIAVNTNNPVKELTTEQVKAIFSGEIKNWSEVGGEDLEIVVISRESGSGTRTAFEEIIDLFKDVNGNDVSALREDALVFDSNGSVKASIASQANGIAYLSLGYIDESMNAVSIDGVVPSVETVKSDEYTISRPLLLLTNDDLSAEASAYLDYCLSDEGQAIVAENYISIIE